MPRTTRPSPNRWWLGKVLGFGVDFQPGSLSQIVLACPSIRTQRRTRSCISRKRTRSDRDSLLGGARGIPDRHHASMAPSQSLCSRTFSTYNCSTRPTYPHAMAAKRSAAVDTSAIMGNILVIRGHRVLLDSDLASLYQVETKALTRAVRRNAKRFPEDFMFQLAVEETGSLRSQSGAFKTGRKASEVCALRFYGAGRRHALIGS